MLTKHLKGHSMTYVMVERNLIGCAGASLTMEQGARAYDKAALFLFGAETEVNFRPEDYQEEFCFVRFLNSQFAILISSIKTLCISSIRSAIDHMARGSTTVVACRLITLFLMGVAAATSLDPGSDDSVPQARSPWHRRGGQVSRSCQDQW